MRKKSTSRSVRIQDSDYKTLKRRAEVNNRPIMSELSVILAEAFNQDIEPKRKRRDFSDLIGLITDLPPDNYSEKIDDILYGGE